MSRHNNKTTFLQIRITPKLAADLKQVADQEANTASAVVRRFISSGVSRELNPGFPMLTKDAAARRDDDQER